ncbi:MAG TPA: 2Fe-2S iron-sulfur cluster-binding protein [Mycobacteriales bacterium]|nr:2Fe-2S iron-sulfur cluster-binding protein [Mycobacteriales bacterium]
MADFHPLRAAAVDQLTDDAVAVTFEVPPGLEAEYAFRAGQHLTLRRWFDDQEVRRTYSLCAAVGGPLRIGVKRSGLMSAWLCDELKIGDELDVLTPLGSFGPRDALQDKRLGLLGAGSGITPLLSVAATALGEGAEVLLLLGNRTSRDVMLVEDVADLKDVHPERFQVVHVLSQEQQGSDLVSGRLEGDRLRALVEAFGQGVDAWYLCGPFAMVEGARTVLAEAGAASVHVELFHPEGQPPRPVVQPPQGTALTAVLGGRTTTTHLGPGETVLDGVLRVRSDAPYACKGGVCGTCRARLVEGEVQMDVNYALEPEEVEAGVVLTCQSRPTTESVRVDYL